MPAKISARKTTAKKPAAAKPAAKTRKPVKKPIAKPGRKLDQAVWLEAALAEAATSGWTRELPRQTAARLGLDPALAITVFPTGTRGIVAALNDWADDAMLARIEDDAGYRYLKVRQKIAFAMRARLEALTPYRPALQQLPGWATRPDHGLQILKSIWATVDSAWYEAGDTTTDYNYYTKRLLLAGVLIATKLFWLKDESRDQAATWAYLDARIDDVLQLGQKISGWKQMAELGRKFMRTQMNNKMRS